MTQYAQITSTGRYIPTRVITNADLNEMLGEQLIHEAAVTALFDEDGTLTGSAGCNDYTTHYRIDGGEITIDPNIHSTLMDCGEAIMAAESLYLASLQEASVYEIEGEVMFMRDNEGTVTLVYGARSD